MASSRYYYNQYCKYKNQVKDLKNKRSELEKIEKEFGRNPVSGDPNDYNKKIDSALGNHAKALSGDNAFNALYSALEAMKEKEVLGDSDLNTAHRSIQAEIRSLNNQISDAQNKQDEMWRKYQNAKYQERVAADNARC